MSEAGPAGKGSPDALQQAKRVLESVVDAPLERHPELFATFDTLLREALDAPLSDRA